MEQLILTSWTAFKALASSKQLGPQFIEFSSRYDIFVNEGILVWKITLMRDGGADVTDFETNYKAIYNKPLAMNVGSIPTFPSRSFMYNGVVKKFYTRNTGVQYDVESGSNTLDFTNAYPWVKIYGVEVIGCQALDYADFKVFDNPSGTYSGISNLLLNQFSFSINLPDGFYTRPSLYDSDLYEGMLIRFTYNSVSAKRIGVNLIMSEVKS